MVLTCEPCLATTTWDFLGWLGVRFGLLYPDTPALDSRGSFLLATLFLLPVLYFSTFFLGFSFRLRHTLGCVRKLFLSYFRHDIPFPEVRVRRILAVLRTVLVQPATV